MNVESLENQLRLAGQFALLGNVPSTLRSVSLGVRGKTILLRAVFDAGATEDDRELLAVAGTEVLAAFDESFGIDEEFLELSRPTKPPRLEYVVFERAEPEET